MSRIQELIHKHAPLTIPRGEEFSAYVEPPPALDEFTCFPKLPNELRHKIWGIAANVPRMVKVLVIERDRDSYAASFPGQSRHPAILGVNLEARDEGMKYYHKIEERARYLQPQFPVMGQGPPQGRLGLAPPGSRLPYMIIGQGQGTGPPLGRFGLGPPGRFPYMVMPKAKPNVMYVNFDVDYFVMPPLMYSAVRVVSLSDWNLEPYVLSMMQKLQVNHYYSGQMRDLEAIFNPIPLATSLTALSVLVHRWSEDPLLDETVSNHLRFQYCKMLVDTRIGLIKADPDYKFPEIVKVQFLKRYETQHRMHAWYTGDDAEEVLEGLDDDLPGPVLY